MVSPLVPELAVRPKLFAVSVLYTISSVINLRKINFDLYVDSPFASVTSIGGTGTQTGKTQGVSLLK